MCFLPRRPSAAKNFAFRTGKIIGLCSRGPELHRPTGQLSSGRAHVSPRSRIIYSGRQVLFFSLSIPCYLALQNAQLMPICVMISSGICWDCAGDMSV